MAIQAGFAVRRGFGQVDEARALPIARGYAILRSAGCDLGSAIKSVCQIESIAGMAELADAADSKSAEGNLVGVRPPLPAP